MGRQRCNRCCSPTNERDPRRVRLQNGRHLPASRKRWIWKFSFRRGRQRNRALCKSYRVLDYSPRCSSGATIETSRDVGRSLPDTCPLDRAIPGAARRQPCVKPRCRSKHRSYRCVSLYRAEGQVFRRDRHRSIQTKRSEEHTSELQSHSDLVCRLLLEKKKYTTAERLPQNSSYPTTA